MGHKTQKTFTSTMIGPPPFRGRNPKKKKLGRSID